MKTTNKTKEQLLKEIEHLKAKLAKPENAKTESKEVEKSILFEQDKASFILEKIPVGISVLNSENKFTYINPLSVKLDGYPQDPQSLLGEHAIKVHPEQNQPKVEQLLNDFVSGEKSIFSREVKRGKRTVEISYHAIRNPQKKYMGLVRMVSDITERKKAEKDIERLSRFPDENPDPVLRVNIEGIVYYANIASNGLLKKWKTSVGDKLPVSLIQSMTNIIVESGNYNFEEACDEKVFEICCVPIENYGYINLYAHDITGRKQAEEALRESEERFRSIFETAQDSIFIKDRTLRYTHVNPSMERLFDLPAEKLIGRTNEDLFGEETGVLVREVDSRVLSGKIVEEDSNRILQGITRVFHVIKVPVRDGSGRIIGLCGIARDITKRKQAEKALRDNEEMLNSFMDSATDGIVLYDSEMNLIEINKKAMKIFPTGSRKEDCIGKNVLDLFPDLKATDRYDNYLEVIKTGKPLYIDDLESLTGSGKRRFSISAFKVGEGLGIITADITDRKQAEEDIKESEERYRVLFENSSEFLFTLDLKGNFTNVNQSAVKLSGYTKAELLKMNFKDYTSNYGYRKLFKAMHKVFETGKPLKDFPVEAITKDKTVKHFETCISPLKEGENIIGFQGSSKDITKRKQVEEKIKEKSSELEKQVEKSEEQRIATLSVLSDLNETTEDLHFEINVRKQTEGTLLKNEFFLSEAQRIANLGSYELDILSFHWTSSIELNIVFGIDDNYDKSLEGWGNIVHPDEREDMLSYFNNNVIKEGQTFDREYRIIRISDNQERWVHGIGELEFDDDDKPVKMIGTIQDITDHKLAEVEIRKLSHSVEQSPAVVIITDTNGSIEYVNPKFEEVTGYTAGEVIGKNPNILKGAETTPEEYEILWKTIKAGGEWHGEFHNKKKNGEFFWESASISGIKNSNEQTTHFIAIKEDITERKAMEQRIRKSRNQLRSLAERLQMIREEERASVAREIHDDLGQTLTALKMDISWMKKNPGLTEEIRAEKINTMLGLTDSTIQTVKRIATELRPGILDDLGLIPAIEWETEEFRKRIGIECNLEISVEEISIEDNISIAVFRIFQESLTNIARHSGATKIDLTIKSKGDLIQMEIADNGVGITEEQMNSPKSLGLIGMNERVSFFGGKIAISRGVKGGTTVRVYIPILKE